MKSRVFVLLFLLLFRIALGWIKTLSFSPGERILVTGGVYNIYHNGAKCIVEISIFRMEMENFCALKKGDKIKAIGTIDRRVIDVINGDLWLRDAKIDKLDSVSSEGGGVGFVQSFLDNFRTEVSRIYHNFMPNNEAGLVMGILFGYKKDISQKLYEEMISSGTVHVAVASGYNIMLIGGLVMSLTVWFLKRKWASVVAVGVMILYALISGGEPPVVRAVWMASILFVARILGRVSASWWVLFVTCWFMLMWDPSLILSVSFQLSVMASVGLFLVEPWMTRSLMVMVDEKVMKVVSGLGLLTTVSTMISTAPIIWWHFGRMTLIGILSNIMIVPLIPILMFLATGMLVAPWVFWLPTNALSHWMVGVIEFFGR